jgi:trigger factor
MVEKMYGPAVFYDEAANALIPKAYTDAEKESGLEIVSRPQIEVVQIEKGKAFIFTAEVATKPEVTLGDYKGVEVAKTDTTVTDEDVQKRLEQEQRKNSREITREAEDAAQDGDTLTLDFEGKIDGVAFDGGTASNQTLKLGSNSFIPGFEAQLVGVKTGETKDITVTFPEDYHAEELKGKEAVFTCTVHKSTATELPELDDEFAEEVSEFETLKEYKDDIKKNLTERRKKEAADAKEAEALEKLVESTDVDIPEEAIDDQTEELVREFGYRMQMQGMDPQTYMKMTGMTPEVLMGQMRPEAERRLKTRFILEAIVDAEKIVADEAEVDKEIEDIAKMYRQKPEDYKKSLSDRELDSIKKEIAVKAAAKLVADKAKEVERESASASEE